MWWNSWLCPQVSNTVCLPTLPKLTNQHVLFVQCVHTRKNVKMAAYGFRRWLCAGTISWQKMVWIHLFSLSGRRLQLLARATVRGFNIDLRTCQETVPRCNIPGTTNVFSVSDRASGLQLRSGLVGAVKVFGWSQGVWSSLCAVQPA